jgi:hypothetical protein
MLVLSEIVAKPVNASTPGNDGWFGADLFAKARVNASQAMFSVHYVFMISNPQTGKPQIDYSRLYGRENGDSMQNETLIIGVSPE